VPHEDGELSSGGYSSNLLATLCLDSPEERAQRARRGRDRPDGFYEHGARISAPLFGDVAVEGWMISRLPNLRIEPEIAHELLRGGKASDISNRGQHAGRDDYIDSTDRHEPANLRIAQRILRQEPIDLAEIRGESIVLDQVAFDETLLVLGQGCPIEPRASPFREELTSEARNQVRMQDGLHSILEPGKVSDNLCTLGDAPALGLGCFVGDPHFGKKAGRVQFREHPRIDLVRLDPSGGNCAHLERICNDYPLHKRREKPHDDRRVPCFLEHHFVARTERSTKCQNGFTFHCHPAGVSDLFALQDRDLPKRAMNVESYNSHEYTLLFSKDAGSSGSHDNYGFALAAQPGESKGRPDNNASSQLIVNCGLPAIHAPDTPILASQRLRRRTCCEPNDGAENSMPDNNAAERSLRAVALGRKNWLFAGSDDGGERAANIYSLLGTARLNDLNPEAYLRYVLERIADHPITEIDKLLPWNVVAQFPAVRLAA